MNSHTIFSYLILFCCLFAMGQNTSFAQSGELNVNVDLLGTLNTEPIHYAGCWGYTDSLGREYALVGAFNRTSIVAIDDPSNLVELDYVIGPGSNWREITVVGHHAYVVTQGLGPGQGMQIINLSYLPDSVHLAATYDATFNNAHIIQNNVEPGYPYVYICGTDLGPGVHILDVSNPIEPVEVGQYSPYYIHDCHPRGDKLYASAIYEGSLDIVDISDVTTPALQAQIPTEFTHSSWTNEAENLIFITDEVDGLPAQVFDISDLSDIKLQHSYTANEASLVHNPYFLGDFGFISHNTEGLRVLDITDLTLPVEVGFYDTYLGESGGFHGLWSAYPFFDSGKIIGANRADGLYVFEFKPTYAGRIYGTITDAATGLPIPNASINLLDIEETNSNFDGAYKMGTLTESITYNLSISAENYDTLFSESFAFTEGDSLVMDFALFPTVMTGIVSNNNDFEKQIYLQKNNQVITIQNPQQQPYSARIFDHTGRLVQQLSKSQNIAFTIALKELPKGVYFLEILGQESKLTERFFVGW